VRGEAIELAVSSDLIFKQPRLRIPAARFRPGDALSLSPLKAEGAGNAGRWPHPQPRLQIEKSKRA
jgi:hypothetical protein